MDLKSLAAVFGTVFLAELGDKTQLATVLFSAQNPQSKLMVFAAAASGLVLACAIGVLAGSFVAQHVDTRSLTRIAGIGFILIGAWTLWRA
jgi:putative Ca2+/H+ antiporter (TMEM165/GDT1 family)